MQRSNIVLNEESLLTRIESYNQGFLEKNIIGRLDLYADVVKNIDSIKESIYDNHDRQAISLFAEKIKIDAPLLAIQISSYINQYFFSTPEVATAIFSHLPESNFLKTFNTFCNVGALSLSQPYISIESYSKNKWLENQTGLIPLCHHGIRSAAKVIEFVKTHNLTKIDLFDIDFTDDEFIELGKNCPNLTAVNFPFGVDKDGVIGFIKNCHKLTEITYGENYIDAEIGEEIAKNCPLLKKINFYKTSEFSDKNLTNLVKGCPDLTEIVIFDTCVTDKGLIEIAKYCPNLTKFICESNPTSFIGASAVIKNCAKLTEISINDNDFGAYGDLIIEDLKDYCPNLTKLRLSKTQVSEVGFKMIIESFPNLEELFISDYYVRYEELVHLATDCPNLVSHYLDFSDLSDDEYAEFLNNFPHLA